MVKAELTKVRDFLEKDFEKIDRDESISVLTGKLRRKDIQEAVVMDGKRPAGVISYDILMRRGNLPMSAKVGHFMVSPPTLALDNNFIDACEALFSSGLRIIPVEEKGKLEGVVTRRSVIRVVPRIDEIASIKAREVMSHRPVVAGEKDDIMKVKSIMVEHDIKAVPVVNEDGELIGVVGLKDIAETVLRDKQRATYGDASGNREKVNIPVKSIMHVHPIFVGPGKTLGEIAKLMIDNKIGGIIITEGKKPVGIVHQIDIIETAANLAPREGVYVQISGVEEAGEVYDELYEMIEKSMKKIVEIIPPRILNVHVVHHHDREGINYTIRLRMTTEKKTYYASQDDWNIFRALSMALEDLERQVKKDKEKYMDARRKP